MDFDTARDLGNAIGTAVGLLKMALGNKNDSRSKNSLINDAINELARAVYKIRLDATESTTANEDAPESTNSSQNELGAIND